LEIKLFSFSRRCSVVNLTGCGFVLVATNHLSVRFASGLGHHHG